MDYFIPVLANSHFMLRPTPLCKGVGSGLDRAYIFFFSIIISVYTCIQGIYMNSQSANNKACNPKNSYLIACIECLKAGIEVWETILEDREFH